MEDEDKRTLLRLEWENFRYQDGLRWSRVQTVGIIEGAMITGVYSNYVGVGITQLMKLVFAILLSIMVLSFCALAEKDGRDSIAHHRRALDLEASLGLPLLVHAKRVLGIRGHHTLQFAIGLITLLNVCVIADLIYKIVKSGIVLT